MIEVGEFTLDEATGAVAGPKGYMEERFSEFFERLKRGGCPTFEFGAAGGSPSVEVALLVAVQTDYAGWRGQKQMEGWLAR